MKGHEISFRGFVFGLDFYNEYYNDHLVSYLRQNPFSDLSFIYVVFYMVLFSLFYYLSFNLMRSNKLFKSPVAESVDTSTFIQSLEQMEDIQELNKKYCELIIKWPQFESLISKNYKLRKLQLEQKS